MSTTQFNTANTEGVNVSLTYTAYDQSAVTTSTNDPSNPGPPFAVGTTIKGTGDSDFVFIKASAAIAAGDVLLITTAFLASGITTTNATATGFGALVGVAVVAIASGSYGWVQRAGFVTPTGISVAASCTPYAQLATTSTAGTLDDATSTALIKITGIIITTTSTATATSTIVGTLNYPIVGSAY